MDKIRVRGDVVRLRRRQLRMKQKYLAHELGVSERTLRNMERTKATWDRRLISLLATVLLTPLEEIVFAVDGPKLVTLDHNQPATLTSSSCCTGKQLVQRFDTSYARLCDSDGLFESARMAHRILVEYHVDLNDELAEHAAELIALMGESRRNERWERLDPETARAKEIVVRMRWLLVQLKGNDILVFVCDHMKNLPESDEVVESRSLNWECQAIVAFAPPQEWGEDSVEVKVDNGQPYIIDWDKPLGRVRQANQ